MLLTAMQDKPNQGIQAYGGTLLIGMLGDRGAFPACRDCLGGASSAFPACRRGFYDLSPYLPTLRLLINKGGAPDCVSRLTQAFGSLSLLLLRIDRDSYTASG